MPLPAGASGSVTTAGYAGPVGGGLNPATASVAVNPASGTAIVALDDAVLPAAAGGVFPAGTAGTIAEALVVAVVIAPVVADLAAVVANFAAIAGSVVASRVVLGAAVAMVAVVASVATVVSVVTALGHCESRYHHQGEEECDLFHSCLLCFCISCG